MSHWDWTAVGTVASAIATAILAVVTVRMASLSKRGLDAEERREKSRRTPFLIFDFSDGGDHENLGAIGFRHLQSKNELLVSGTIRNVGNTLAVDVRLDIFQYLASDAPPVHEISAIPLGDALPAGGSSQWSRMIGITDLIIEGPYYKSGILGLFSRDTNNKYNHFHVVFSCRNADGESFCSIYCVEKIIKGNEFKGNQMRFVSTSDKYDPGKQFPDEWHDEIQNNVVVGDHAIRAATLSSPIYPDDYDVT
jgi:hypothetical protein